MKLHIANLRKRAREEILSWWNIPHLTGYQFTASKDIKPCWVYSHMDKQRFLFFHLLPESMILCHKLTKHTYYLLAHFIGIIFQGRQSRNHFPNKTGELKSLAHVSVENCNSLSFSNWPRSAYLTPIWSLIWMPYTGPILPLSLPSPPTPSKNLLVQLSRCFHEDLSIHKPF